MMPTPKAFVATTVPLENSNLIEASAGTGKTYSIAILVIRLLLEKKFSIKEILMVTYTKAAVAELEERIRLFVRDAYRASKGEKISDAVITSLVGGSADLEEAKTILREAVLFLDETSVLTIHSFCQKTLNEFAFETNQLFGAEAIKDTAPLIEEHINKFWRKNITTLPAELLKPLIFDGNLSRKTLSDAIKQFLAGKKFFSFDENKNFALDDNCRASFIKELKELKENEDKLEEEVIEYVKRNAARLRDITSKNKYAKNFPTELFDRPEEFIQTILSKRKSGYIRDLFDEILEQCDACDEAKKAKNSTLSKIINHITCFAIQETLSGIKHYKQLNNQISFDDMIANVHNALMKDNSGKLSHELQKKYKAVFVDEFQDTDRMQYEIFQKAFKGSSILFYIGDPKQSIYSFRKADIFTYFKAYKEVENIYQMNENFRSSSSMIDAMNQFFLPAPGFDTFFFKNSLDAINYVKVTSPSSNKKGRMLKGGEEMVPITITRLPNKQSITETLRAEVIDLLTNKHYAITGKDGHERNIKPSDIAVLVRSGVEGRKVKEELSKNGVPAVTITDDKILCSDEARGLLYLLDAFADTTGGKINKALLSPFTAFKTADILQLDKEKVRGLFNKYKARWEADGIYTAIMDFIADFNVRTILLNSPENGERIITNLFHLAELLHKIQSNKMFSQPELLSWLKRGIQGMEVEGDEYLQRIENDEDAVKIATIHSSKGLEYPIVIAPFLDLLVKVPKANEDPVKSFRDPETGDYISMRWSSMNEEHQRLYSEQEEQENRRLLYVAITRAVYKCSVYRSTYSGNHNSSLAAFAGAVSSSNGLIAFREPENVVKKYNRLQEWKAPQQIKHVHFNLAHQNWVKMSYTMLAAKHDLLRRAISVRHQDEYNDFVFRQLKKGAITGNLLHQVFENIDFSNAGSWQNEIRRSVLRFAPQQKDMYEPMLYRMMTEILNAPIHMESGFKIADIVPEKRIQEFEFDFPVNAFSAAALESLSDENIQVNVKSAGELEGIMNGKIDLFFEHKGKYFILDWKSNYLGDTLQDYSAEALSAAMNDNNYHLQYLIYTIALKKYLESRLKFDYHTDFGGVIYLFLRGVRRDGRCGIFTTKPSVEKIAALEKMIG